MLMDRIVKALTFKREVYAEVEHDTSFTGTAWGLVAGIALIVQLVSNIGQGIGQMLIASLLGAAAEVLAFAVGAYVVAWVGKALFKAEVTFDEMVRALGLAYVWRIAGALGGLGSLIPALGLLLFPVLCVAAILSIASWFVATREALDLDTGQTIITVLLGWVAIVVINIVLAGIIASLGFAVSTISSGFSS